MNKFQRIKSILFSLFLILLAVLLAVVPETSIQFIGLIISLMLLAYGVRQMWYYFSLARHMVGGKAILYQGIIVLDIALFSFSVTTISPAAVAVYLLSIFAFTGAVDILRALEAKKLAATAWKMKFITGIIHILAAVGILVSGVFFRSVSLLVYGYCVTLVYYAIVRIIRALRRTAIIYIQ